LYTASAIFPKNSIAALAAGKRSEEFRNPMGRSPHRIRTQNTEISNQN